MSSEGNQSVYEIAHLTKGDEGKYLCNASNSAGSKSESLSLIVDDAILCKANEFRCKSGDQCVPKEDRCDNERDCKGETIIKVNARTCGSHCGLFLFQMEVMNIIVANGVGVKRLTEVVIV